ncbi:alpha/beta hydrolase [Bradyrhizobium sediminis]|uniref:Alpha/beta hydrolase n=1 Tax=Bradyrhizobium sediminis TaxID=2840469 RepID=A0A975NFZ8_9BRAD|nr:alpha/beta hydrolase [Bradyrhizobium sediminis]QWG14362.1 alpha/beta hydrolase [Bradyrhizobium sediminis]
MQPQSPKRGVPLAIDDYDQQYDVFIAAPDIRQVIARGADISAVVRTKLNGRLDVAYGDADKERLDFFPAPDARAPLVMFIHGGYWHALDKSQYSYLAPAMVDAGLNVAVLNYPLLPNVALDEVVDSVRRAAVWLWREAASLGFDRDRVFAAGHSAGGHLTAMLLATRWAELGDGLPESLVKGGVSVSGLHDLEPLAKAPFIKDILRLGAADVARLSPVRFRPNVGVRLVTAVGEFETSEFHRQTALLGEGWPEVLTEQIVVSHRNHADVIEDMGVPGSVLFRALLRLVSAPEFSA